LTIGSPALHIIVINVRLLCLRTIVVVAHAAIQQYVGVAAVPAWVELIGV
jgi:hypothetical protein